ncbi:MAG: AraC family transcriptional regulator [Blautia sp.]|nr:AraC family transcriptional regulator [Blautia sp.]MCM1199645.1 AraC family transcriptional regulator [Bacteroides fragilis]
MPLPLRPGYHFNYDHICRQPHYKMPSAEAYTDFYGISYMISGERLIYSPESTAIAQAGDIIFIPKYVYLRSSYIADVPYEHILIKFTDSIVNDLFQTIGTDNYNMLCAEHVVHLEKNTQDDVLAILHDMEKEWNCYNKYSELLLKGLLNKLIILCLRERIIGGINAARLEKKHGCLADAITYIETHLRESPSLDETARWANISSSYLSKLFISHLKTSFSDFVINEKITFAQKLLADSELSMTEIADEAGFSSHSYFSDSFKRNTGMTPMQFRREFRRK